MISKADTRCKTWNSGISGSWWLKFRRLPQSPKKIVERNGIPDAVSGKN